MWLLPIFSPIAKLALSVFYRLQIDGPPVPIDGPVLLVANHPNSLLDPAAVVSVAGRPVRFLAKAPLFNDPLIGWLVRGSGAIPVHRRQDDPLQVERNDETFQSAHEALHSGDAIGIFPEGLSHSEPALTPLRTGAARIALGAASLTGTAFPIIPIGLVFEDKQRFRSPAFSIIGSPVRWDDLAQRGERDAEAVRELTRLIDEALREVTINLERHSDARVVLAAEQIFNAERGVRLPERERIRALREVSLGLSRLRREERRDWLSVARAVAQHARTLRALGMRPDQLSRPGVHAAVLWTVRQGLSLGIMTPPALVGFLVYWIPFRITGVVARRYAPTIDTQATYKLLVGLPVHLSWTVLFTLAVTLGAGLVAGVAAAAILPVTGWIAVRFRERWANARETARRFLIRERREEVIEKLRERQAELATRLTDLREALRS